MSALIVLHLYNLGLASHLQRTLTAVLVAFRAAACFPTLHSISADGSHKVGKGLQVKDNQIPVHQSIYSDARSESAGALQYLAFAHALRSNYNSTGSWVSSCVVVIFTRGKRN